MALILCAMVEESDIPLAHPSGEATKQVLTVSEPSAIDTFGGKVFIRWEPDASVTGFGLRLISSIF